MVGQSKSIVRKAPFVGRQRELQELDRYLDDAEQGKGSLILVAGEAGIGKTRLVEEFRRNATDRGILTLVGRSHEGEASVPFGAVAESLSDLSRVLPSRSLRRALGEQEGILSRIVPAFVDHESKTRVRQSTPPTDVERLQLFNAVRDMLARTTAASPLLLVLEDLHWGDVPTLLLIRHLAQSLGGMRLILLCTYRTGLEDEGDESPIVGLLEYVHRERLGSVMSLGPLSGGDVQAMLEGILREAPDPSLAAAIFSRSEGNPFFVEEYTRHLAEEGLLFDDVGRLVSTLEGEDLGVPEGVRVVTARRLARLSEACRRMLTVAAVIGRRLDFDLLDAAVDMPGDALLDAVDEASRTNLLVSELGEHGSAASLVFVHELVRQTLVQRISAPRQQQLHLRIAEAIARLHGENKSEHASDLAYHYLRAGSVADRETTLRHVMRAAESALTATAYEDAASFLEAALRLIPHDEEARRGELLLMLGDAEKRVSDSDKAREYYRAASQIARQQSNPDALRRAALGFARSWPTLGLVDDEAVGLLREALASYDRADATSVRAGVMARLALQLYYSGDVEEVKRLSAGAIDVARASGDKARLASVLQTRHVILWEPEYLDERLRIATEIIELAAELGSEEVALWGHRPRVADYTELGAGDEMRSEVATYARLAQASRRPLYVWQSLVRTAMLASYEGRFADAERLAQEALAVGRQAEGQNLITAFGGQLLVIRWQQGRMAELEPFVRSSMGEQPHVLTWPAVLAFIFCETGRLSEAREAFEALYSDGPPSLAADNSQLVDVIVLALVCGQLAAEDQADDLYRRLSPYAGRNIVLAEGVICVGAADYYLGVLSATMRRWDDAVKHLELAIRMNAQGAAAPWLALAQYDCGRVLLARRKSGDRQAARLLLEEARSTAARLQMGVLLERCDRLAKRSLRASNLGQDGLTARELDVLRLIAQGRNSQEISDQLSLSPRTTARHITNLYGKIGARNRSDATAYAIRMGLV